ncbi:hypothetical protein GCM10009654_18400 [Streptomyces hebeiensis]|uniref:Glycoside hydrolase family 65 n=1 Tax=Streptomyces hebeiensis TaxID=229486 RepID=A0ABP4FC55_9ACTN
MTPAGIDRRALVTRHNPVFRAAHPVDVLTVGNGDIAMTVDVSGLQTFPAHHELRPDPSRVPHTGMDGLPPQRSRPFAKDDFQIPLRTQSSWGWYATRGRRDYRMDETMTSYASHRGAVAYPDRMGLLRAGDAIPEELEAGAWLSFNPRRLHLGRLTLDTSGDLAPLTEPAQLGDVRTALDLYSGLATARYLFEGVPVVVRTAVDPESDTLAVRIESDLLRRGLGIAWVFDDQKDDLTAFEHPPRETVRWERPEPRRWTAVRAVESSEYVVELTTTGSLESAEDRRVRFTTDRGTLDVAVALGETSVAPPKGVDAVFDAAARWWSSFWESAAALSFEGSTDPRAPELERRVVLSQYLTAVNCAGASPPQESGLVYNTWNGKFHLEMHWLHGAHFPMWGRGHLLERSIGWYHKALPAARATAARQGYRGARWPKQTDLSGRESPSSIGAFLIWQQPHIIYLLELLYRERPSSAFLEEHYVLVEATAAFMADFVAEVDGCFELGPPVIPAQESYMGRRSTNANPTFELSYWAWALRVANRWRERLQREQSARWEDVSRRMRSPARLEDGTYAALSTPPYLLRTDHPSMLMAYGWLPPGPLIDKGLMEATFDGVRQNWDPQSTWGWDYPILAMTATELGDLGRAIESLLVDSPKNVFVANGHNPQMRGFLSVYLPSNGALLAAVARMARAHSRGHDLPTGWAMRWEGFPPDSF